MIKGKLTTLAVNIASCYFETIQDFINLELGCPSYRLNLDKFYYNPIPINENERKLFNNLETLHIFDRKQNTFENDAQIVRRVFWYNVDYRLIENIFETNPESAKRIFGDDFYLCNTENTSSNKIYKRIWMNLIYDRVENKDGIVEIPENIYGIMLMSRRGGWSSAILSIKKLIIPDSLKIIKGIFGQAENLTSIEIGKQWILHGDRLFDSSSPYTLSPLILPDQLKEINGKKYEYKPLETFDIPSFITKLDDYCFDNCVYLKSIIIPESVKEIGNNCFSGCVNLTKISIPSSLTKMKNSCFSRCFNLVNLNIPTEWNIEKDIIYYNKEKTLSFEVPKSILNINGKKYSDRKRISCFRRKEMVELFTYQISFF